MTRRCDVCGESFRSDNNPMAYTGSDERAEVYDPLRPEADSIYCHASCIPEGYEIA